MAPCRVSSIQLSGRVTNCWEEDSRALILLPPPPPSSPSSPPSSPFPPSSPSRILPRYLVLVLKPETERKKFSSRSMRLKERNSGSCLETHNFSFSSQKFEYAFRHALCHHSPHSHIAQNINFTKVSYPGITILVIFIEVLMGNLA